MGLLIFGNGEKSFLKCSSTPLKVCRLLFVAVYSLKSRMSGWVNWLWMKIHDQVASHWPVIHLAQLSPLLHIVSATWLWADETVGEQSNGPQRRTLVRNLAVCMMRWSCGRLVNEPHNSHRLHPVTWALLNEQAKSIVCLLHRFTTILLFFEAVISSNDIHWLRKEDW